jgi:hypothetical protein
VVKRQLILGSSKRILCRGELDAQLNAQLNFRKLLKISGSRHQQWSIGLQFT